MEMLEIDLRATSSLNHFQISIFLCAHMARPYLSSVFSRPYLSSVFSSVTDLSANNGSFGRSWPACHAWTVFGRKVPTSRFPPWTAHLQEGIFSRLRHFALLMERARRRSLARVVVRATTRTLRDLGILSLSVSTLTPEDWLASPFECSCGYIFRDSFGCAASSATTYVLQN